MQIRLYEMRTTTPPPPFPNQKILMSASLSPCSIFFSLLPPPLSLSLSHTHTHPPTHTYTSYNKLIPVYVQKVQVSASRPHSSQYGAAIKHLNKNLNHLLAKTHKLWECTIFSYQHQWWRCSCQWARTPLHMFLHVQTAVSPLLPGFPSDCMLVLMCQNTEIKWNTC